MAQRNHATVEPRVIRKAPAKLGAWVKNPSAPGGKVWLDPDALTAYLMAVYVEADKA